MQNLLENKNWLAPSGSPWLTLLHRAVKDIWPTERPLAKLTSTLALDQLAAAAAQSPANWWSPRQRDEQTTKRTGKLSSVACDLLIQPAARQEEDGILLFPTKPEPHFSHNWAAFTHVVS